MSSDGISLRRTASTAHTQPDLEQGVSDQEKVREASPSISQQEMQEGGKSAMVIEGIPGLSEQNKEELLRFWDRFRGKHRRHIGFIESAKNAIFSSWLNILLILTPFAWISHFREDWQGNHHAITFTLCFFALMPLEALFDWGGEQMALFLGKTLGDLIMATLNNSVEATLAIILLKKCELKILQSSIIGVILLHLLLIPGASFMFHGARIWEQDLHPHHTQLNLSLLTIGAMALVLPAAFFAALDRGTTITNTLVTDAVRGDFLKISRGLAVMLILIYIGSRIFLHDPPGAGHKLTNHVLTPEAMKKEEWELAHVDPEVNVWFCIALLAVGVGIMAFTAECLVESIEFVRESGGIKEEWFGLVLLPIVSFAADGAIAVGFCCSLIMRMLFRTPVPPSSLAKARAVDLAIQFIIFWMPFIVLLGWWTDKPMTLLFDFYEVAVLLAACFLVNYITADSKTNWVEGFIMLSFYVMIVLCTWFYPGQTEVDAMHACPGTVADALAAAATGGAPE